MNLNLEDLFNDIRTKAGISDSPASRRSFMRALLFTLGEVNPRWDTAYAPDDEEDPSGDLTVEAHEYAAIVHGIRFYLQQDGSWAMETDAEAWGKFDTHVRRAIGSSIAVDADYLTRNGVPDEE